MKEVALSQGYRAQIDDEDFERVNQFKWSALVTHSRKEGKPVSTVYAVRRVKKADGGQTTIRMHRFIMEVEEGVLVDHEDHNGLNNQRYNLRTATSQQNSANQGYATSTSGLKGVTWNKKTKKWKAQIMVNRKQLYLGEYFTPTEAAYAYDAAASKHFGEFAHFNFDERGLCC